MSKKVIYYVGFIYDRNIIDADFNDPIYSKVYAYCREQAKKGTFFACVIWSNKGTAIVIKKHHLI